PDAGGSGKVSGHPVIVENANRKLILAPLGRAGVVAFDWASRQEVWRSPALAPVFASPALMDFGGVNSKVAVAAASGEIMVLDSSDGKLFWHARLKTGMIEADPVIADLDRDGSQDILIAGYDFKLHAFSGAGSLGAQK
ncbi:MAG: PQQ-binding-like beta-propeller repeat protein, partial [Rhodomicrobium sp.]